VLGQLLAVALEALVLVLYLQAVDKVLKPYFLVLALLLLSALLPGAPALLLLRQVGLYLTLAELEDWAALLAAVAGW